jgi:hypothetical protein
MSTVDNAAARLMAFEGAQRIPRSIPAKHHTKQVWLAHSDIGDIWAHTLFTITGERHSISRGLHVPRTHAQLRSQACTTVRHSSVVVVGQTIGFELRVTHLSYTG